MQHDDGLDELREQNLRDPLAHASALFNIERSSEEISQAVNRIADITENHAEATKERFQDLSNHLVQHGSQIHETATLLRHIQMLLIVIVIILVIFFFKLPH